MAVIRFTPRAREDLLDIWAYIAEHTGLSSADRIFDQIEKTCRLLQEHPRMGRVRTDIADNARSIIVERWIVLYRLDKDEVQIVRVVDGVRDLARIEFHSDQ